VNSTEQSDNALTGEIPAETLLLLLARGRDVCASTPCAAHT